MGEQDRRYSDRDDGFRAHRAERARGFGNRQFGTSEEPRRDDWRGTESGGGRDHARPGAAYDEDHDRNIIDRVVDEIRSWFDDGGRDWRPDRGRRPRYRRDYPDYGSDYARAFTGREDIDDYRREGDRFAGEYEDRSDADRPQASWQPGGGYPARTNFVYSEFSLVPGPHVGVGPKGYRRSAERMREEICERLQQHGQIDASDIEIEVDDDGEVRLSGIVDRREAKRLAEDVAESVSGVHDVHNEIRIRRTRRFDEPDERSRDASYQEGLTGSTARTEQAAKKPPRTDH